MVPVERLVPRKRKNVIEDSEDEVLETPRATKTARRNSFISMKKASRDSSNWEFTDEEDWQSLVPTISEKDALKALLDAWHLCHQLNGKRKTEHSHIEFEVDDFSVYFRRETQIENETIIEDEMCTLQTLRTKKSPKQLFFDGTISCGNVRKYVKAIAFDILFVTGYNNLKSHGIDSVFIQTNRCKHRNIWLRLTTPNQNYKDYYSPFVWIANFGKHVVDYLIRELDVTLSHFQSHFHDWLQKRHKQSEQFQAWVSAFRSTDFRNAFIVYFEWLWSEITYTSHHGNGHVRSHPIWTEANPERKYLTAVPEQQSALPKNGKTIVTPYVFQCFQRTYFGSQLQSSSIGNDMAKRAWRTRKEEMMFSKDNCRASAQRNHSQIAWSQPTSIRVGDVIGVPRDEITSWESKADTWFFHVNRVKEDHVGLYYEGLWLYEPHDTTLSTMYYPFGNELFLSDNCNCGNFKIRLEDVISKIPVVWNPQQIPAVGHFVRQTYHTHDQSFRSFKLADFHCKCLIPKEEAFDQIVHRYAIHDTVLVQVERRDCEILEPCIINAFLSQRRLVRVRQLQRAKRDFGCSDAKIHELVWTSKFLVIDPKYIVRPCNIRFCLAKQDIPMIYERNGQADCFLITKRVVTEDGEEMALGLETIPVAQMKEGMRFDLPTICKPMETLSLFCGGGNFDRGLEEAGVICTRWAVEWNPQAVHTYRANLKDLEKTNIFFGPIDEHLRRALAGEFFGAVPSIGKVEVLIAGSPCTAFSSLQPDQFRLESLINSSKVATVASYIDLWRPKYAIFENVLGMAKQLGSEKSENVFAQFLCCLVGMGYQIQQLLMDAWSYGDPQSRTRLFIIATAPGLPLLPHPNMTHRHPEDLRAGSLGKAANGEPFGIRYSDPTALGFVSARNATSDLPDIGEGFTKCCIAFPDHRPGKSIQPIERKLIRAVPKQPPSQGLADIINRKNLPDDLRGWIQTQSNMKKSETSNSYRRFNPRKLFKTVLAKLVPGDAKAGHGVHWDQDRVQTILEARRAQGFPDCEPIIGDLYAQWKIIGNSVSRAVALAIGMSLREIWLHGQTKDNSVQGNDQRRRSSPITPSPLGLNARPPRLRAAESSEGMLTFSQTMPDLASTPWKLESLEQNAEVEHESLTTFQVTTKGNTDHSITVESQKSQDVATQLSTTHIYISSSQATVSDIADEPNVTGHRSVTVRLRKTPRPQASRSQRRIVIESDNEEVSIISSTFPAAGRTKSSRATTLPSKVKKVNYDDDDDDLIIVDSRKVVKI